MIIRYEHSSYLRHEAEGGRTIDFYEIRESKWLVGVKSETAMMSDQESKNTANNASLLLNTVSIFDIITLFFRNIMQSRQITLKVSTRN